tara:strand:+ start:251 stop:463 length:213 start_codon:yes stop_codon:yes gene_type:complete
LKIILENKTITICILVFILLVIGLEVGIIPPNPIIKNIVGMGLIGGGSVLLILVPIFIIQKLWVWIKSKL